MAMDVVDYEIKGAEMQFVEVELDPGEAAVGEAGSMMFMDAGISMDTVFGDGRQRQQGGLFGKLLGAGKRLVTGESLFTTVYTNQASGKQRVAFAAPYPGKILPMDLRKLGGTLICQKDAFLCAARGVSLGIHFQQKLSVGFFGGEGFIMQKLEGDGLAFVHAGGTVLRARPAGRADAAGRHRLPGGDDAQRELRDPVRRQDQDGAVRRRGPVLRQGDRPGHGVAAEPAVLAPGLARVRGGAAAAAAAARRARCWAASARAACSAACSAATTSDLCHGWSRGGLLHSKAARSGSPCLDAHLLLLPPGSAGRHRRSAGRRHTSPRKRRPVAAHLRAQFAGRHGQRDRSEDIHRAAARCPPARSRTIST